MITQQDRPTFKASCAINCTENCWTDTQAIARNASVSQFRDAPEGVRELISQSARNTVHPPRVSLDDCIEAELRMETIKFSIDESGVGKCPTAANQYLQKCALR